MKSIAHIFIFLVLTVFTQVGGIIYILSLPVAFWLQACFKQKFPRAILQWLVFLFIYTMSIFFIVPPLAALSGRVTLPARETNKLRPVSFWTVVLNRNYVRPSLKKITEEVAIQLDKKYPGTILNYLDAGFPFLNGFPLFPHLSHNDGRKLDLAFSYIDHITNKETTEVPSPIGYGICEEPVKPEIDQPCLCGEKGFWQYNLMRNIIPQGNKKNFVFDERKTKAMVLLFLSNPGIEKIFIEPHLKQRMGLAAYNKIRFHGCQAVRHDDHLHVQVK